MPVATGSASGGWPIAGALALQPINRMEQQRYVRQERLQLLGALQQQQDQQMQLLQAQDNSLQSQLDALSEIDILPNGQQRIQSTVVDPLKKEIKDRIANEYGGRYSDFLAAEGQYYGRKFRSALKSDPTVRQEMNNKLNYGLIVKDMMDGKILRSGDRKSLSDYQNGIGTQISYTGSLNAPTDVDKYFADQYYQGFKYGSIDPKTKAQRPFAVTANDVTKHLVANGYSPEDADYITKNHLRYRDGQYTWKMDQLSPTFWRDQQIQEANLGLAYRRANQADRAFNYRVGRDKIEDAQKAAENGAGGGIDFVTLATSPSIGYPAKINGFDVSYQPITSKSNQNALRGWAGIQSDAVPDPYAPGGFVTKNVFSTLGYNGQTQRVYSLDKSGDLRYFNGLSKFADKNGNLELDTIDDSRIYKFPRKDGTVIPVIKAGHKGNAIYIQLPQDNATMQQVVNQVHMNQSKATKAASSPYPVGGGYDDDIPLATQLP